MLHRGGGLCKREVTRGGKQCLGRGIRSRTPVEKRVKASQRDKQQQRTKYGKPDQVKKSKAAGRGLEQKKKGRMGQEEKKKGRKMRGRWAEERERVRARVRVRVCACVRVRVGGGGGDEGRRG